MNALIVYAHHEPKSFNGALKDLAINTLKEQGHSVQVSDLYAMNFNPVATKRDFLNLENPEFMKYQMEQLAAFQHGSFTKDIKEEIEKVKWADFILFQFPLWWFSVPAILKGWFDRVFAMGFIYGPGVGVYSTGGLKGKKAMLSVTTGGPESIYTPIGRNGDIHQILFPINHGVLFFSGMEVLPPFLAYSVARNEEERKRGLEEFKQRILSIDSTDSIPFHPSSHYDDMMQLKPEHR